MKFSVDLLRGVGLRPERVYWVVMVLSIVVAGRHDSWSFFCWALGLAVGLSVATARDNAELERVSPPVREPRVMRTRAVQTEGATRMLTSTRRMKHASINTVGCYPVLKADILSPFSDPAFCEQWSLRVEHERAAVGAWLRPANLRTSEVLQVLEDFTDLRRPWGIQRQPFLSQVVYLLTVMGVTASDRCEIESRWNSGYCVKCGARQKYPEGLDSAGSCRGGCWRPRTLTGAAGRDDLVSGLTQGSVGGTD